MYKIQSSEASCNTLTANTFSSKTIRLYNKGNIAQVVSIKANSQPVALLINASANGTTLLTLASGDTSKLRTGMLIMNSTNTAVVNTGVASNVASITNTTAFVSSATIILANGATTVYAVDNVKTISILAGTEMLLSKGSNDLVDSDAAANVLITAISYLG